MKSVPPKTSNLRALATTWIVAAVVVLCFELVARVHPQPVWEREEEQLVRYQAAKIDAAAPDTILLLGDSSLGNDVDARVLSEQLGMPTANLALVASFTTVGDAVLLERALHTGKTPRAIVLFHTPDLWSRPFAEDFYAVLQRGVGELTLETVSRSAARTLALVEQSKAWQLRTFVAGRGLGWEKDDLQAEVDKAAAARAILPELDYIPPAKGKTVDWPGFAARIADGTRRPQLFDELDPNGAFRVDPHVERWWNRTLDLAARHSIPVFVVICPVWAPKSFYAPNRKLLRDLHAWLEEESAAGTRFRMLARPALVVTSAATGDKAEHLAFDAKAPFTLWLGARLQAALAGRPSTLPDVEFWDPIADQPVTPP